MKTCDHHWVWRTGPLAGTCVDCEAKTGLSAELLGYFGIRSEKDLWQSWAEQILLTNVAKAAEDLGVIINTDPKDLESRPRLEVDAFRRLVDAIQKLRLVKDMSFTDKGQSATGGEEGEMR